MYNVVFEYICNNLLGYLSIITFWSMEIFIKLLPMEIDA